MSSHVLVIDDDKEICAAIEMVLRVEGYQVESTFTGLSGLERARSGDHDLIIMDLGLPDIEGQQLCKAVCKEIGVPLIILSARDSVADKVLCLEYGADDYLTKPFESIELIARIHSVLRRSKASNSAEDKKINQFGLSIDIRNQLVFKGDRQINLTPKEYELLTYFANHVNAILERDKIIEDLWGRHNLYRWSRSLDVHIQHLRKKIEPNPKMPLHIQTVSGVGYKINP